MTETLFVIRHALWIAGGAISVAAWSWTRSLAPTPALLGGVTLFCIGMASVSGWLGLVWLALAALCVRRWMK